MYLNMIKDWELGPALITSAKFVLAYPFVYHAVNGVRHLVGAVSSTRRCPSPSPHCLKPHWHFQSWDFGRGIDMKSIYFTGWFAVIGSAVIAALVTQM